jgi:dTDP-4-dehydrorhamnose reductase
MKIAITGAGGLFGFALVRAFAAAHAVHPLTRAEADLTKAEEVQSALGQIRPDAIIHAAAIPGLDTCEADPAKAFLVNVHGTRHVVEAARELGAAVAYISTDAVFDGKKQTPYVESDRAIPPTVYGRTKLRAEQMAQALPKHWVFRVSVLFGPGKNNFVERGLRRIAAGENYVVAADQLGSATYTPDAAQKILEVVAAARYGLYHLSNSGACSRLDLARRAAEMAGLDPGKVIGAPSEQMGRLALRLKYAVMEMEALTRAGFSLPRPWPEALEEYVRGLVESGRSKTAGTKEYRR